MAGCVLLAASLIVMAASIVPAAESRRWTFDGDPVGEVPHGWEAVAGRWEVRLEADGRNRVLVRADPSLPGVEVPVILAPTASVRDVRAAVKIKRTDRGAFETMGLIVRWQDPGTMIIIRTDGAPGRIWLERVRGGRRSLQAGYFVPVRRHRWNHLRVEARGDWLNLFFNGKFLGGLRDEDPGPGRIDGRPRRARPLG